MLQAANLSKAYGDQIIFEDVSFSMVRGERLGLVGRNGSGKSTLFRIILGEETADSGTITFPRGYVCGHLAQHLKFTENTVLGEACLGLPPYERDQEYKAEIILGGLGFTQSDMYEAPETFSGGFQIRINLAKVLLSEPNLLLLDEPTNYLDIVSVRWLIGFLRDWKDEVIIISHDRDFMDSVTTHTMIIRRNKIRKIPGNTEKLYTQIELDEEIYEKTRVNEGKKRKEIEVFINRFRAQAAKATLVQSKVKALERMGVKEELRDEKDLDFEFRYAPFQGKSLLEAKGISFKYPDVPGKPKNPVLIENFSTLIRPGERIGIIGKNGKGKSTLLKLLSGEMPPDSGEIVKTGYLRQGYFGQTNISRLDPKLTVEDEVYASNNTLSRTAVRNICGTMMFSGDDAEKKISVLSGGEKSRVMLGKILAQPSNLLLLDEPSNHLDMESIQAIIESMKIYQGAVLIVTHSELILRELVSRLIVFQDGKVTLFNSDYDDFLKEVGWDDER
jgi:ATP-binding cassette subfamily F protein 3